MPSSVVLNVIIFVARVVNFFYSDLFTQTSDIFQPNIFIFRGTACAIESFYLHKFFPVDLSIITSK